MITTCIQYSLLLCVATTNQLVSVFYFVLSFNVGKKNDTEDGFYGNPKKIAECPSV